MFTIDASVWVNADSPSEAGQLISRAFIDAVFDGNTLIVEPSLLPVEIAGVISRTRGDQKMGAELAAALLGLPGIQWVSLDKSLAKVALDLAAQHKLRGADAVYAAVAKTYQCQLVSLDQEHLSRLTSVVATLTPAQALAQINSAS
jgi:predicted nucleic acid-binding protein